MTHTERLESRHLRQAEESGINSLDCYLVPLGQNLYYFTHIMLWSSLMCQVLYEMKPLPRPSWRGRGRRPFTMDAGLGILSGPLGNGQEGCHSDTGWGGGRVAVRAHVAVTTVCLPHSRTRRARTRQSHSLGDHRCRNMRGVKDGAVGRAEG